MSRDATINEAMLFNRSLLKKFLAGSLIFYILSGLTSFINYLFYPVIARFVNVAQYGEIQFLVSMFTQLSVGFIVLNILAIIVSAKITSQEKQQEAIATLNSFSQLAALLIAGIGVTLLIAARQSLSINGTWPIVLLGVSLLANVPFTIVIGRLQGNGKFITSGVISLVSVFTKLIASLLFTMLGMGVAGVIGGIAIGLIIGWLIGEYVIHFGKHPRHILHIFKHRLRLADIAFLKHYAASALLSITILTLLSSADSIVSRIVFDSHLAGQYASIATITKTLLAIATPIMWLALPPAVSADTRTIRRYIRITALICGGVGAMIIAVPNLFTTILIGVNPGDFLQLITPACIAMIFCALSFLTLTATICLQKLHATVVISLIGIMIYSSVFVLFNTSLHEPLTASLYSQIAAAVVIFTLSYRVITKFTPRVQS